MRLWQSPGRARVFPFVRTAWNGVVYVTALYFGSSQRRLFGVHHRGTAATGKRHAVLLCYPGVQEYNGAHWVFRRLASMLERAGHDVLRFDYFATGDSAGEGEDGRFEIWVENVVEAAAELKAISSARSVSVVGMRLGAAIALAACEANLKARTLVLWEPVVTGIEYLNELEELDKRRHLWLLHGYREPEATPELLGFTMPDGLRRSLLAFDACARPAPQVERVAIVAESEQQPYDRLRESLAGRGIPTVTSVVKDDGVKTEGAQRERVKLSHAVLVEIVKQLEQGVG